MESYQLQIQIGEYLVNLLSQLDQKMNTINEVISSIDSRLSKLENMQMNYTIYVDSLQRLNKCGNGNENENQYNSHTEYENELKRKISVVKKERDFQRLLEKEKIQWEKDYKEQDEKLAEAKQEWEHQMSEKKAYIDSINCSYIS